MREILFRGKRLCNSRMMFGSLFSCNDGDCYIVADDFHRSHYRVDPETVGQFTGLTDKNGKKVFEHDILQLYTVWENGTIEKYALSVVQFSPHDQAYVLCCGNDLNVRYGDFGDYGRPEYYEVIGNIHDNPELLGGADHET